MTSYYYSLSFKINCPQLLNTMYLEVLVKICIENVPLRVVVGKIFGVN